MLALVAPTGAQAPAAARRPRTTRCSRNGRRRSRCRRSRRSSRSTSCRPSRKPSRRTARKSTRSSTTRSRRRSRTPSRRSRTRASCCRRCRASFGGAAVGRDERRSCRRSTARSTPLLSALRDEVRLNEKLFQRIKAVYDKRATLKLTPLQNKLVEEVYKGYVRAGANLDPAKKEQLKKINAELSMLTLKFGDNQLHDTNAYKLVIDKQDDLKGLPPSVVGDRRRRREGREDAGQVGLHAAGAEHLAVPAVRGQPRAAAPDPRRPTRAAATTATSGTTRRCCRASRRCASSARS